MSDIAFLSPPLAIEPEFLDHNGHVNMAYHLVLADRALDLAFAPVKGDRYPADRGMTTFAAELHVRYVKEIRAEDVIRGRVRWIANDAKRVHWTVELIRDPTEEVATTVEGVSLSVSLETRRAAEFPNDVRGRLEAVIARHEDEAARPDWLGRRVAMRRD